MQFQNLPSGIAPEYVAEGECRNIYRSPLDRNREDAKGFAIRWKLKQLRRIYEPLGAYMSRSARGTLSTHTHASHTILQN
jgi:hypothetical protein